MTRRRVIRVACALWLWFAPGVAAAGLPLGSFDFTLGGHQSIWLGEGGDDAGEAVFCEQFAASFGDVEHCVFELAIDGKGRIGGFATFAASRDGLHVALAGPIKGSRRGNGETGYSKASYEIKLAGEVDGGEATRGIKASLRFSGRVAPGGVASGHWDERTCIQGERCASLRTPVPTQTLTNGNWDVELEIADAGGGTLTGSARIGLGDGSECPYDVRGRYDGESQLADLTLTPITPACAGTSIQLQDVGTVESLPAPRSSNQELFAFICNGTLEITAGTDPSACSWSVVGAEPPPGGAGEATLRIGQMKYELFGYSGRGLVHSIGTQSPSYGRATFIWVPKGATIFTVVSNFPGPGTLVQPVAAQPAAPSPSAISELLEFYANPQFGFR